MPAGKVDLTQFAGMVTAPGLLERNPASCVDALNWEFPAPGLIRKRRGFARQPGNAGGPIWSLMTSRLLDTRVLAHVGTTTLGTQLRIGDGSAGLTAIPTIDAGYLTRAASADLRMHLAVCQRNHYVTANESVARVESGLSVARYAGMPRGQDTIGGGGYLAGGTANPLADGYARAYRLTWHRKDNDGVELGGAPTARKVVANRTYTTGYVGTARAVALEYPTPPEFGTEQTPLTTDYFWRLWGTHTYNEAAGELGNDEMFLVAERYLTAGEIASLGFVYLDDTPDAFLLSSPRLHTNLYNFPPGEAGLLQGVANEDAPPPAANDIAYWQDVMWYADFTYRPRLTLALIANFAAGDTVTTVSSTGGGGTVTLTAGTDFGIFTGGPTLAINLRQTVALMMAAFNDVLGPNSGQGIWGYSVGTSSTQPGLFYLELALGGVGGAAFSFNTSVPGKFQTTEGYILGNDAPTGAAPNGLAFSKPLRADAVPPVNVLSVGPADLRILRLYPLGQRLLVFTDSGIYQVTGRTFADFAVNPFDLGYRLIGREMVAECDEKIYAWCYEGVIEISSGGVTVVSTPIEPTIEALMVSAANGTAPLLQTGRAAFGQLGFAVAYRNQHQVRFHFPGAVSLSSMYGSQGWLSFDTRTRAWARGLFSLKSIGGFPDARSCGVVRFGDDLLCVGCWSTGTDTFLFLERRAYVASDFLDDARDGTQAPLVSTMRMQYQLPDEAGAQHWQQTVINWDAEEISWRPLPTTVTVIHATEEGAAPSQSVAVSELATRVEPPQDARRGQRLYVQVTHSLAEYCGIVGLSQNFRAGSKFARKVTP